jgi:hypothetical protein
MLLSIASVAEARGRSDEVGQLQRLLSEEQNTLRLWPALVAGQTPSEAPQIELHETVDLGAGTTLLAPTAIEHARRAPNCLDRLARIAAELRAIVAGADVRAFTPNSPMVRLFRR